MKAQATAAVVVRGTVSVSSGGLLNENVVLPLTQAFIHDPSRVEVTLRQFTPARTMFDVVSRRVVAFLCDPQELDSRSVFLQQLRENQMVLTGEKTAWAPSGELWGIAWTVVSRLAVFGAAPDMVDRLRTQSHDAFSGIVVTCGGVDIAVPAQRHRVFGSPHVPTRPLPLGPAELTVALSQTLGPGEHFVSRADSAMDDPFGSRWFIADLCTAIETAAYARFKVKNPGANAPNFNPRGFLGRANCLAIRPTLWDVDPEAYASCCELWGTRNEMLHNATNLVRIYDPAEEDVVRARTRPFEGAADRLRFRRGVLVALGWLRAGGP